MTTVMMMMVMMLSLLLLLMIAVQMMILVDDSEDDGSQADGVDAQLRELWEDILCCETFTMQTHADSSNSRNVILVLGKESEPLHRTPTRCCVDALDR